MEDVPIPPERVQDPAERNEPGLGLGRDPVRTPMQWDGGLNAGFTHPGAEPWLPLASDFAARNVAAQAARWTAARWATVRWTAAARSWGVPGSSAKRLPGAARPAGCC